MYRKRMDGGEGMPCNEKVSEWFYLHFFIYYMGCHDVEDFVQEVFIRAIKGFDSYRQKSTVKTWLFSIARQVGSVDDGCRYHRCHLLVEEKR